jgi:hypothetical protein
MGNCVATWADKEAKGIKARKFIIPGVILGVYGGIDTIKEGIYTLDVSVTGHARHMVDGDPSHGQISKFGRINEDTHTVKKNTEFDVAGIIYTENEIREGEELLTTYGDKYRWEHVIQIGYDRLKNHLTKEFPELEVDLPQKIQELKSSNPLQLWIKNLVRGETNGCGHHSTKDDELPRDSAKAIISYLTSNVAARRYSFGKCGLEEPSWTTKTAEDLGRKYMEYATNLRDYVVDMPFNKLIKTNMRVGIMWSAVTNAKLIREKKQPISPQTQNFQERMKDILTDLDLGGDTSGPLEERLTQDIITKFPWMLPIIEDLRITGINSNQDPISIAIMDVIDNRLDINDLHSSGQGKDWTMGDGLAAYLRSSRTYRAFNTKPSEGKIVMDEQKKKFNNILQWNPDNSKKVSISTLLRIHKSTRVLARSIKAQIGEEMRACPIRGDEDIVGQSGRVKISLEFGCLTLLGKSKFVKTSILTEADSN